MDYKILLTIFILVLMSNQLWNIIWDIGKGGFYIVVLLLALTYLEPSSVDKIKKFIRKIINLDFSFVINILSKISKFILIIFNKFPKMKNKTEDKTEDKTENKTENKS